MKKFYLTLSILFIGILTIQAQFTVSTHDGTPITDGSVFTYSTHGTGIPPEPNGSDLEFYVVNTSSETSTITLEYMDMINADGEGDNLCIFGLCYVPPSINVGDTWSKTFLPGESTFEDGDHFFNTDEGDGVNYPVEYVFRFFDVEGNGDPITFTYRYDGTVSVEDMPQVNFKLYPTVSSDFVNLVVDETVSARLINTQGQLIKQFSFEPGTNIIDLRSFSKQMYYLVLTNKQGYESLTKLIIK